MVGEIDIDTVARAYARWAPIYDFVFGAVFDAGRKASIAAAECIGGRILDVGIGTGISLLDYAPAHLIDDQVELERRYPPIVLQLLRTVRAPGAFRRHLDDDAR